jgi:tetratricopeptide (TPR) repeat protein
MTTPDFFISRNVNEQVKQVCNVDLSDDQEEENKYIIQANEKKIQMMQYIQDITDMRGSNISENQIIELQEKYNFLSYEHYNKMQQLQQLQINKYIQANIMQEANEAQQSQTQELNIRGREYFDVATRYYNDGNFEKSILLYEKCMDGNVWTQDEIWTSKFKLGHCYKMIGNIEKSIYNFLDAYDFSPDRIEAIYEIIYHYRHIGKNKLAFTFYEIAKNKMRDGIKHDLDKYKMDVEYTIIAMYNGKYEINDSVVNILNNAPNEYHFNLFSNMKFYKNNIVPNRVIDLSEIVHLDINDSKIKFNSSSGCMIKKRGGGYMMNIRFVNYYITDNGNYIDCDNNILISANKYVELDKDFKVVESRFFDVDYDGRQYVGIEDVRIFNQFNKDYIEFIGTCYHTNGTIGICTGSYNLHDDKLVGCEVGSPTRSYCEKNWVYFECNDETHIIYKWFPLQIYKYNSDKTAINLVQIRNMPRLFSYCRGSTCGFRFQPTQPPDELGGSYSDSECVKGVETWFIVHIAVEETPRSYYHVIAVFDENMNLNRYSAPFKFEGEKIEYCLSLIIDVGAAGFSEVDFRKAGVSDVDRQERPARWVEESEGESERIIINYSTWDRTTKIAVFRKNYIESLLKYKY